MPQPTLADTLRSAKTALDVVEWIESQPDSDTWEAGALAKWEQILDRNLHRLGAGLARSGYVDLDAESARRATRLLTAVDRALEEEE